MQKEWFLKRSHPHALDIILYYYKQNANWMLWSGCNAMQCVKWCERLTKEEVVQMLATLCALFYVEVRLFVQYNKGKSGTLFL